MRFVDNNMRNVSSKRLSIHTTQSLVGSIIWTVAVSSAFFVLFQVRTAAGAKIAAALFLLSYIFAVADRYLMEYVLFAEANIPSKKRRPFLELFIMLLVLAAFDWYAIPMLLIVFFFATPEALFLTTSIEGFGVVTDLGYTPLGIIVKLFSNRKHKTKNEVLLPENAVILQGTIGLVLAIFVLSII